MPAAKATEVEVDGRRLRLTNLDKVLYPEAHFTKAQVIDYYARIAPTMLTHCGGRGVTLRRFPNGVEEKSFFEKRCPSHRPEWIDTAIGPGDRSGGIGYCLFDEVAALVWAANMAALEIHAPMARGDAPESPTMVVFDFDPGPGTAIPECAQVALAVAEVLEGAELESWVKTSGSKGLQLYVPLNTPHTHEHASSFALAVGQVVERADPKRVTTTMAKAERKDRVFIDWSQNSFHKTTVCAYSLRARPRPTVSTPVSWEEVAAAAEGQDLSFEAEDVLERVADLGDLFEPTATVRQKLPQPRG